MIAGLAAWPVAATSQTVIEAPQYGAGAGLTLSRAGAYALRSSAVGDVNAATLQFNASRVSAGILATTGGVSLATDGYVSGATGVVMQGNSSLTNRTGARRINLAVESAAGTADFADAPRFIVNPVPTSKTVSGYYEYRDFHFNGPGNGDFVPTLQANAANLFYVDASDGRGLISVFSNPIVGPGGSAAGWTTVSGSPFTLAVVDDDINTPESRIFAPGLVRSIMGWDRNKSDGFALANLTSAATVDFRLDTSLYPLVNIDRIVINGTAGQAVTLPAILTDQRLRFTETTGGEIRGADAGVRFAGAGATLGNGGLITGGIGVDAVADLRLDGGTGGAMTGRIVGTVGAGVSIGGRLAADFTNRGTVQGATDGLRVADLDGRTIRNAAGATIRGGSGAALQVGGSGRIVNEAGAVLASPDSLSAGIVVAGSGAITVENAGRIDGAVRLGGGNDILVLTDGGTIGGAVEGGGGINTLRFDAATANMDSAVARAFSRFQRVEKTGGKDLTVSGTELAAADVVAVHGGALRLAGNDRLSAAATVTADGGTLDLGGFRQTVGLAVLSGGTIDNGTLASSVGFDVRAGRIGASLAGAAGLAKTTSGTVMLSGINTYAGPTEVRAGTLTLGGGAAIADTGAVTVGAAGTLSLASSEAIGSLVSAGTIDGVGRTLTAATYTFFGGTVNASLGTGTLTQRSGTTMLSGSAAAEVVRVDGGTLRLGAGSRLSGTSAVTVDGGLLEVAGGNQAIGSLAGGAAGAVALGNGTLTVGGDGRSTAFAGTISGTGALAKVGSGTLVLSGANSYTGGTTVTVGTLQGDASSLQGNIVNHASVVFDQATAGSYAGVLSGSGQVALRGGGVLELLGRNTYMGATAVTAGTLLVNGSIANSSLTTVPAGATLGGNGTTGSVAVLTGGTISPGNSIGTLTISGNFTQAGAYRVEYRAVPEGLSRGRNTLEGSTLAQQDADLIHVTGTALLTGGGLVLQPLSTQAQFNAALAASPTGQVRYLILRAEGGRGGTQYVALSTGNVSIQYPNATDVELVLAGTGGGSDVAPAPIVITTTPPAAAVARDQALWQAALTGTARLRPRCDEQNGVLSTGRCGFVQGDLGLAGRSGEIGQPGVLGQAANGLLGAGFAVRGDLWLGVAAGVGGGSLLNSASGSTSSTQTSAFLWGRWTPGDADLRGWLGGSLYDVRGARSTLLGGGAWARYGATQGMVAIEGRYWWTFGGSGLRATPLLGVQATWLDRRGYAETGGGIENFQALPQVQGSLQSLLGVEAQWTTTLGQLPLMLEGRLGWANDVLNANAMVAGIYVGDAGRTVLTQAMQPLAINEVRTGVAAVLGLGDRTTLRLDYEGGYATDAASHRIALRVSVAW